MRYIDDPFLAVIAHQTRVTNAMQQLNAHFHALGRWQAYAIRELAAAGSSRVQHELSYYHQQIVRWQNELERLATESNVAGSA
ncbi:MAG: hypothetical protein ABIV47_08600 [Roseiflexaceae bacterium]